MARNLQSKNAAQEINPLLQALHLEDRVARQKEIAEILKELDEDKAAAAAEALSDASVHRVPDDAEEVEDIEDDIGDSRIKFYCFI